MKPGDTISYEQAEAMLPDTDRLHTFVTGGGIPIGADWDRDDVLKAMAEAELVWSGHGANMGHELFLRQSNGGRLWVIAKLGEP